MPLGTNVHNAYRLPNTTNLHLHGGHISGMDPGDNVKVEIAPGQQHTYEYTFPKNHMPGTSWYHPHFHGSTSIQTGMGVAGMVIVEDPPGYVPAQIAQLPEINLMIQHLNLDELSTYANVSGFEWWQADSDATVYGNASSSTGNTNLMLINMQYIVSTNSSQRRRRSNTHEPETPILNSNPFRPILDYLYLVPLVVILHLLLSSFLSLIYIAD